MIELTSTDWKLIHDSLESKLRQNNMFRDWYKAGILETSRDEFLLKIRESLKQEKHIRSVLKFVTHKITTTS